MPHRTVFQWGKNHAHPFTTFIGGFIIGALVTGVALWAWAIANGSDIQPNNVVHVKKTTKKAAPSPSPRVTPSASPSVSF